MQNAMGWVLTMAAMDWNAALLGYDAIACAIRFVQSAVFIAVGFAFLIYPVEVCSGIDILQTACFAPFVSVIFSPLPACRLVIS
jgi:hypothetical protein